ncbi:MAG: 4Fe-4S dicluster domain-containing protein [Crenarchaeota archaeon]|nr:4Fe-4S dicluster domain-containing protein [Thermoproteota archaeon]
MAKGIVHIEKWLCKGCGLCIMVCPRKALEFSDEVNEYGWRLPRQVGDCIACRMCERMCPDMAIWIEVKE